MDTDTTTAGAQFRAERERRGVSLRALAHRAYISHSSLSRWERGERDLSASAQGRIRWALRSSGPF